MKCSATLRTLGALALVVACLGLPLNSFADFVILLIVLALLVAGRVRSQRFFWGTAGLVTAMVLGVRAILPLPEIQEGHNVFIYDGPGGVFEKALPAAKAKPTVAAERSTASAALSNSQACSPSPHHGRSRA